MSPAAASLAIRGEPGVSRETRDRVLATARRIGYRGVSHASARRMKSITIGLIIKAPVGDAPEANRFYAPVMAGIEELCRIRDIDLLFAAMPVDDDYHPLEVPRLVTERATDGLIIIGAHLSRGTTAALVDWPHVDPRGRVRRGRLGRLGRQRQRRRRAHRGRAPDRPRSPATSPWSAPGRTRSRASSSAVVATSRRWLEAELRPRVDRRRRTSRRRPPGRAAIEYVRANPEVSAIFAANDAVAVETVRAAQRAGIVGPARPLGRRLRRHRPRPLHHAAADHHGRRQAGHGSARRDAAAPPPGVPRRRARPGRRADVARRARIGRPAGRRGPRPAGVEVAGA